MSVDATHRRELRERTSRILEEDQEVENHLRMYPWLTGALGEPSSPVWFVGENPSLTMVERATDPTGGPPTEEAQWWASRGDRLFRDLLYKHGFKSSPPAEPGGWRCYITNVIKQPDYSKLWRNKSQSHRNEAAVRWAPLFQWELDQGRPGLVVALGNTVRRMLEWLDGRHIDLPDLETVAHYSYVAHRPEGKLGPMHPEQVERYDAEAERIAELRDDLTEAAAGR